MFGIVSDKSNNLLFITHRALQDLDSISDDASKDPEILISNPLTAYKFVRQLRNVGIAIEKITKKNISKGKASKQYSNILE